MATLSYAALEQLWTRAGGNPKDAPTAAAIAEAESSGRTNATSSNPDGGTNVGLWQLDTPGGKGAGYSIAQLMNPSTNAKVAVAGSSDGADWSAWQTYVQGTYLKYLGGHGTAPGSSGSGSSGSGSSGSGSSGSGSSGSGFVWWEPWTWPAAAGDALSGVEHFGLYYAAVAGAVLAGIGLVIVGAVKSTGHSANPVNVITATQAKAAPAAEAAAAVA